MNIRSFKLSHGTSSVTLDTEQHAAQPHEHLEIGVASWSLFTEQRDNNLSGSGAVFVRDREMWRTEDDEHADAWWNTNDWQTASGSGWWTTGGSQIRSTDGCWSKSPRRGREQDRNWTDSLKFGERFYMKEAKEQRTRRWQRPREETVSVRARRKGARVQGGAVLSSFATAETNEQMEEKKVTLEVPHDTRICIEDLVDMEIDQLRDDEKKGKQPGDGTQEPKKKTAMDRDPRTRGDSESENKWNAQTRTAQSSSNLSLQCSRRNLSGRRMMKSELLEAKRTPLAATLSADTDSRNKEMKGSLEAYTDYVDGKLRAEIATSIREADSELDEMHRALKSALEPQVIVCSDEWLSVFADYVGSGVRPTIKYAEGGAERHDSVTNGLRQIDCHSSNAVSWKRTRGRAQGGASGPAESKGGI